jgi:cell division topological specificity factor
MSGIFDRILGRSGAKGSSATAKERLQFILVHDRINLPPERLQQMKAEILAVISKYVSIDSDNVDIALQQRERDSLIIAEIPFVQEVDNHDEARRRFNQQTNSTGDPSTIDDIEDDG